MVGYSTFLVSFCRVPLRNGERQSNDRVPFCDIFPLGKEAASNTMEAIRKKMQQMKKEKEESVDRAEQAEERMKELQGNLKEVS